MTTQPDQDHIEEKVKSKLQEAYSDILEHHDIESGDITPQRQVAMDGAEKHIIELTTSWIEGQLQEEGE